MVLYIVYWCSITLQHSTKTLYMINMSLSLNVIAISKHLSIIQHLYKYHIRTAVSLVFIPLNCRFKIISLAKGEMPSNVLFTSETGGNVFNT